jgi:hypothetical protein
MASTTLFAPQVRAVQPAFVYNKENESKVKIYFNLSSYNTVNDVKYILYTIIDPNKASTWGANSVIKATVAPAGYLYVGFAPIQKTEATPNANRLYYMLENGEYVYKGKLSDFETGKDYYYFNNQDYNTGEFYIEINLGYSINFKELTKNQFYQVQLYFSDREPSFKKPKKYQSDKDYYHFNSILKTYVQVESSTSVTQENFSKYWITDGVIDSNTLEDNKNNISVASQATLIRPIPELKNGFPVFDFPSTGDIYDLPLLKGRIEYEDDSKIETIDTCWVEIYKNNSNSSIKVYTSPQKIKNQLGLSFEIPIDNYVFTNGTYKIKLYYITKHGYERKPTDYETQKFTITLPSFTPNSSFVVNYLNYFQIKTKNYPGILQRQDLSQNKWETIGNVNSDYYDYNIEALNEYEYRIIGSTSLTSKSDPQEPKIPLFDDIFLSDADTMLAVRYNPNISGYKYVTQEGITNTLGGKYPVIRKNGDTRYRQFNLSGTLYMNASEYFVSDGTPSTSVPTQSWDDFFNHLGEKPSLYVKNIARLNGYTTKDRLERQAREIAINFLTNNSIKLFRSPTEGNMIVYLSGVSFTPNKQLGRNVYDFSCTVTEVCEYNMENIKRYNLNNGSIFQEATKIASVPSSDPVTVKEA